MSDLIIHFRFVVHLRCYLQTWPSHLVPSLANSGAHGAMPPRYQDPWLPYCYVCLDSQCLRCLGPIWSPPTLQSRSASACHCSHALDGLQYLEIHCNIGSQRAFFTGVLDRRHNPVDLFTDAQPVWFLHSTIPVTLLRLSDNSVMCLVTYFQFPIQTAFVQYIVHKAAPALQRTIGFNTDGRCQNFG